VAAIHSPGIVLNKAKKFPGIGCAPDTAVILAAFPGFTLRAVTGGGKMFKVKKWVDWAEEYQKISDYTQKFLAYNDEYKEDCKRLSLGELIRKWRCAPFLRHSDDNQSSWVFDGAAGIKVHPVKGDRTITISIDLKTPISVLAHEFLTIVQNFKKNKEISENYISHIMLDDYLRILELLKDGKKAREIAEIMYQPEFEAALDSRNNNDISSLVRKVRKQIKRAREIAQSGTIW
jgi:hypothetical protein